jgi:hypothetical protein
MLLGFLLNSHIPCVCVDTAVFAWRAALESVGHRCCLIYGALPAETRREQARLFNDPNSG